MAIKPVDTNRSMPPAEGQAAGQSAKGKMLPPESAQATNRPAEGGNAKASDSVSISQSAQRTKPK